MQLSPETAAGARERDAFGNVVQKHRNEEEIVGQY